MALPTLKTVRRTLAVAAVGFLLVSLLWTLSLWAERQAVRTHFDRIEVGASFQDVMRLMERFNKPGPNTTRLDWEAMPKDRPFVPAVFGTANVGVTVCFGRDWRVFHKQYHEKPMAEVLREQWQGTPNVAPPLFRPAAIAQER